MAISSGGINCMEKLKGLFRLMRFELPFAAGVCVVMGQLFALKKVRIHS